jgi:pantetheine-phosphate adenylyltransferase
MVDYVRKMGADFVVRGVRGAGDLESESNLAQINRYLMPELETVFLPTRPELACVSSSAVREAALFGADFSAFVPVCILADVKHHFDK